MQKYENTLCCGDHLKIHCAVEIIWKYIVLWRSFENPSPELTFKITRSFYKCGSPFF